jgi:hypothetical protein
MPNSPNVKKDEALAELSNSVTPEKAGVQKLLKNLDSGFRRNDAQGLLQEAPRRPNLLIAAEYLC